jgi:hypothetical protein
MASKLATVNPQMEILAEGAVTAARDKFSVSLDLTENSLQQLEMLLQQAHEGYKQVASSRKSPNISIDNTVRTWGSYFGEVIRRRLGGDWIVDQKEVFLQIGSRRLDPLGQVRSRVVEGPLKNVQSFYKELKSGVQKNLMGQSKETVEKLKETVVEPKVTVEEPKVTVEEPKVTLVEPKKTEEEPKVTVVEPKKIEEEPKVTVEEPKKIEEEPKVTVEEPKETEEEKNISEVSNIDKGPKKRSKIFIAVIIGVFILIVLVILGVWILFRQGILSLPSIINPFK